MTNKQSFQGTDFNGQVLTELEAVQLLSDASSQDHAARLSQVQQESADAVQAALVSLPNEASTSTSFTSSTMVGFLSGKQDNMEIEASSAAYMEIVDGYKIKVKQLLITDVTVDESHSDLATYLAAQGSSVKQEGDVIILNSAVDNQGRSWIKTSAVSQGVAGYTRLQTDYNVTSIRAMFSAGAFMAYSSSTGQYSVDLGTSATTLGGQTLPHGALFTTIAPTSTTASALVKLEELINAVESSGADGTSTVTTRINNLVGVTGANLGTFGGRLPDDSSVKQVLAATEVELDTLETNLATEASVRTDADLALGVRVDNEILARQAADAGVTSASIARDDVLQNGVDTVAASVVSEASSRIAGDLLIDARLITVEGDTSTPGSVAKAQSDAQAYALAQVSSEAAARGSADANLQVQLDAISSAFLYKGYVNSEGRIVHVDVTHANHNALFTTAALFEGDFYKVNAEITLTWSGGSQISVSIGDGLLAIKDAPAGTSIAADVHKTDNTESADILREGILDGVTLEKLSGILKVVDNSVTRVQLSPSVETDIDNKVLKSGDDMTGSLSIDKTVTAGVGHAGGYDHALHVKMKSIDTASLTDTQRGALVENEVYTNGSGNPLALDYANAATITSHYKGSSQDMSVAITGVNGEGRVLNPSAAIYATGAYGLSIDPQLGVNAGGTFVAQNAATANLGVFAFSDTAGALNNRAGYFALAPDSLDFDGYRVARVGSPLPVQDAAVVIDDFEGTNHALFVNGKSQFNGKVIVPSSTADNEAINGSDIKAKERIYSFNLVDGVSKVISTPPSMNLDKVMWQVVDNYTDVAVSVTMDNPANTVTILAAGGDLTGVTLLLRELSCSVIVA